MRIGRKPPWRTRQISKRNDAVRGYREDEILYDVAGTTETCFFLLVFHS